MIEAYVPGQGDLVWINFNPKKGKEVGKYRPALVLSDKLYNERSEMMLCCPVSRSIRGTEFEVALEGLDYPSAIKPSLIHTFDWSKRDIKYIGRVDADTYKQVILKILPLIGATEIIDSL